MELRVSLTKRPYRGIRKAYVILEEARALKLLKVGSAGKLRQIGVTAALVLDTWRRIVGDLTEARAAGNVTRRGTPRGPAQGILGVTSAPLERRSPGSITFRVQYVVRFSARQP